MGSGALREFLWFCQEGRLVRLYHEDGLVRLYHGSGLVRFCWEGGFVRFSEEGGLVRFCREGGLVRFCQGGRLVSVGIEETIDGIVLEHQFHIAAGLGEVYELDEEVDVRDGEACGPAPGVVRAGVVGSQSEQ